MGVVGAAGGSGGVLGNRIQTRPGGATLLAPGMTRAPGGWECSGLSEDNPHFGDPWAGAGWPSSGAATFSGRRVK